MDDRGRARHVKGYGIQLFSASWARAEALTPSGRIIHKRGSSRRSWPPSAPAALTAARLLGRPAQDPSKILTTGIQTRWQTSDPIQITRPISMTSKTGNGSTPWITSTGTRGLSVYGSYWRIFSPVRRRGVSASFALNSPYVNTIPVEEQAVFPGSLEIERRIKSIVRWNAMAMVVRANRAKSGIGGHISTYASCATLFEVGFNHFFRAPTRGPSRRHRLFSRPCFTWCLLQGISGGPHQRTSPCTLSAGAPAGRGPLLLPAPLPHAELLAVSDGFHGAFAYHGHLPGTLHPLPGRPRP